MNRPNRINLTIIPAQPGWSLLYLHDPEDRTEAPPGHHLNQVIAWRIAFCRAEELRGRR